MGITNDGKEFYAKNMIGESVTKFDYYGAHIGVGNSNTAFSSTQTDLQGSNTKRKGMIDTGYPARDPDNDGSDYKVRYKATFDQDEANFKWEEWGVFNDSSAGVMHNREVEYLLEKTNAVSMTLQVDITLSST